MVVPVASGRDAEIAYFAEAAAALDHLVVAHVDPAVSAVVERQQVTGLHVGRWHGRADRGVLGLRRGAEYVSECVVIDVLDEIGAIEACLSAILVVVQFVRRSQFALGDLEDGIEFRGC